MDLVMMTSGSTLVNSWSPLTCIWEKWKSDWYNLVKAMTFSWILLAPLNVGKWSNQICRICCKDDTEAKKSKASEMLSLLFVSKYVITDNKFSTAKYVCRSMSFNRETMASSTSETSWMFDVSLAADFKINSKARREDLVMSKEAITTSTKSEGVSSSASSSTDSIKSNKTV
ncbi:hypothetical protein WICPIJ_008990 [Wickerhamomyces pijperi]|uniref:Uncharacterized protein n=1 Tax=Wickerhamomyces pijperi TaxID=599730 RepID=A0A9P8PTC0_WICPI|nr:hypothetical protein WICPIJ_008990 [Wickerhamomyces pijperi]